MKKILALVAVLVSLGLLVNVIVTGCGEGAKEEAPIADLTAQKLLKMLTGSNIGTSGTNNGSISGKITDMLTGDPLAGVTVDAGGVSAVTDSNGDYQLIGVTPGTINFSTSASGYENIAIVCDSSSISIGLLLKNRSPQGTISGKITDIGGSPVSGVTVQAASETYFQMHPDVTTTDSNGDYSLTTNAGDIVVAMAMGQASQYTRLNLGAGAAETVNMQFPSNPGIVSGSLTNNSTIYTDIGFYAGLIVGKGILPLAANVTDEAYTNYLPPAQGSDTFLLMGYGAMPDRIRVYWDCQYASISAGQTITRNFTVRDPIEIVSPAPGATGVSTTPTFTWQEASGSNFNFYILDILNESDGSSHLRALTSSPSFTVPQSAALTSGGQYYWSIWGAGVSGDVDLSTFNLSQITVVNASQEFMDYETPFTVE